MVEVIKERPILFSALMVRAILDVRKTQTRRVMKFQPPSSDYQLSRLMDTTDRTLRKHIGKLHWVKMDGLNIVDETPDYFLCPYGEIGDRLWIKETYCKHGALISYKADDDWIAEYRKSSDFNVIDNPKWEPSIYMPRIASRITLEITDIRVERLQDISEDDAIKEGISKVPFRPDDGFPLCDGFMVGKDDGVSGLLASPITAYKKLWESINGKGSWDLNPWVWVIQFKRI